MSDVVAHWGQIIHSFNVGRKPNTVFACFLQNTFNAYCDIMKVDKSDFEYYGFCKTLASDLYEYAQTQSTATIA